MKVKKIRNKNELPAKPKKPPEKKIVVRFSFEGIDGKKYEILNVRHKINENEVFFIVQPGINRFS